MNSKLAVVGALVFSLLLSPLVVDHSLIHFPCAHLLWILSCIATELMARYCIGFMIVSMVMMGRYLVRND